MKAIDQGRQPKRKTSGAEDNQEAEAESEVQHKNFKKRKPLVRKSINFEALTEQANPCSPVT